MTIRTREEIVAEATTAIADNNRREISPADVRQRILDLADTMATRAELTTGLDGKAAATHTHSTTGIDDGAITPVKMANLAGLSVLGNSTSAAAIMAAITAGTDGHVLRRSGATLSFGTLVTASYADGSVTLAKMANVTAPAIIGRATAGAGAPESLTSAQLRDSFFPAGSVVDSAYAQYLTNADITAVIPVDDTIPQVTEGAQILSVSITPKSTTNKVRVRFQGFGTVASGPDSIIAALFVNGAANAVRAALVAVPSANYCQHISLEFEHTPASLSAQTYTLRIGQPNSNTVRLNGLTTGRVFGGAAAATLVAEEIKA